MPTVRLPRRCLPVLVTLAGCGSVDLGELADRFAQGDIAGVRCDLAALAQDDASDAHLWLLNRAVADFAAGEPKVGISALRQARDRLDQLRARTYGGWIESVLTDDRALIYDGADYEHVLVRGYLALLDLACGEGDAIAYLNQMLQRQVELRQAFVTDDGETPKMALKSAAIGNWLLATIEADDPTRRDIVERQLRAVLEHEPGCALARRELERFSRYGLCQPGNGVVQVVALVGLGPYRAARDEPVSSIVLDIAHRIYNARRERVAIPINLIQQVQIAGLVVRPGNPTEVRVEAGSARATTEVVTSVDRLAQAEFDSLRTQMVVRAVVRRLFKLATSEAGKAYTRSKTDDAHQNAKSTDAEQAGSGRKRVDPRQETDAERQRRQEEERRRQKAEERDQISSVVWDLFTLIWVALEDVDTRCWALLPSTFQAARLELPEGEHEVVLRAGGHGQAVGAEQRVRVRVRRGRTTFVIAQVPSHVGGPPPVSSDPAGEPPYER